MVRVDDKGETYMKKPINAIVHKKKTLSLGIVTMLLLIVAVVVAPASAVTVPAQSVFIDPTYPEPEVTNLGVNDTFTVDVMVNVTSPTSTTGTGMFGFEYKLFWNTTLINLTSYTTYIPSGWEPPNGFLVKDDTTVAGRHWYGYTCLNLAGAYTGAMSLCTYNFNVMQGADPALNGTLDLMDVKIVDNAAVIFITDAGSNDGIYQVIPEFTAALILSLFIIATSVAIILLRKKGLVK
jgi:hypothetical protein